MGKKSNGQSDAGACSRAVDRVWIVEREDGSLFIDREDGSAMPYIKMTVETTELYLHTSGGNTVRSPLDTAAERNIIPIRRLA